MKALDKITILLHTKNRVGFLLRAIDYYNHYIGTSNVRVIVLDASADSIHEMFINELERRCIAISLKILHQKETDPFSIRLTEGLSFVSTPYVLLAADDDFYYFDWLESAVSFLDCDLSYGVVYGHTIRFSLRRYQPYGELVGFGLSTRIPPEAWLEGETASERLGELGRVGWATVGWYALQRYEILSSITRVAVDNDLDDASFERLLILMQAALTKTHLLDEIALARQNDDFQRKPYSYKAQEESLSKLKSVFACTLRECPGVQILNYYNFVDSIFKKEISGLRRNDSREWLRKVLSIVPMLAILVKFIRIITKTDNCNIYKKLRDIRFPEEPVIIGSHFKVQQIVNATKPRS